MIQVSMFKSWCDENGFLQKTPNPSHVLLDGGCLQVRCDELEKFYAAYVDAVMRGEKVYVVEQKTPTYNFFVDLDYKADEGLNMEAIGEICKVICACVKRYGGRECIVSAAQAKPAGDKIKTGVHLNWPGMVVDQDIAVSLREYIISDLFGYNREAPWGDIVDLSVYGDPVRRTKGSGFRMPWSHKLSKGVVEGMYLPVFKYTWPLSSLTRISSDPDASVLAATAVRTEVKQTIPLDVTKPKRKEGSFTADQMKDEVYDTQVKCALENFIRKNMFGQSDAFVTKVFKSKNAYLVSTTSKFCENIQRKHHNNHVWFLVSGTHILQKCFCTCPTLDGRRDGFCKDFVGRRHVLPGEITKVLYPDKEELNQCKEIKKFENKPPPNSLRPVLERFLNKFMQCDPETKIIDLKRQKGGALSFTTTSKLCEITGSRHDKLMPYTVSKLGKIKQMCPTCKKGKPRVHTITPNILKILKQESPH